MANIVFDFLHNYETGERRESEPANAYQYDEGHVLEAILPSAVTTVELHYWIRGMEEAEAYTPTSITPNADGSCTILGNIPNKYFETNGELRIYIVVTDGDASITTYEGKLYIYQRSMPDDYVDDDPENEATRILTEARAAAATATAAAQTAQDVADSIPADYSQLSEDVTQLKEELATKTGLSEDVKQALLACFDNVVWDGTDGQEYIDALYDALYPPAPPATLVSISCVYTQSSVIYSTSSLDDLKPDLVVTAYYDNSTTQTVTTYTLSGTLNTGTSTITVSYGSKTTTFDVVVSDGTLMYRLPSQTVFDGTNYIDTEVTPFANDHDFTLAFDFVNDGTSNQLACVFRCGEPRLVLQTKNTNTWRTYLTNSGTNYWDTPVTSGVRAKVVMAHTQGGDFDLYVLAQGGTVQSVTKTGWTLATTNNTLYIGANQGNGSQYYLHGTVYDFQIYTRKWSADEISEYLTFSA